ncbi:MAG: hypothetical protein NC293_08970 [Roseburia sp.]|nr:hypothetical protein [Roseburia sp.]
MEILFERIFLQVKGMRTMFLVPLIGYFILIPVGVWAMVSGGEYVLMDALADMCYLLVPFLSTWWIYMIAKEYVEGEGREVLLLGKGTFFTSIFFWGVNVLCFSFLFFVDVGYQFTPNILYLVQQLIIISFFMGGLAYFLNYFTKSITASMFVIILYTGVSNYRFSNPKFVDILGKIQLTNLRDVPYNMNYGLYEWFIALGAVFWVAGIIRSKRIR